MTDTFPPTTSDCQRVSLFLNIFRTVAARRSATYVSSPLTTGPRAFEWHRRNCAPVDATSFHDDVIEPNRSDAANFVRVLREREGHVIIDPTALPDVPGWTQPDYRYFWGRVIEEFCIEVVFRDGWQFSSGCAYELLVAWRSDCRLLREDGRALEIADALTLLDDAIGEIERHGVATEFLASVRAALEQPQGYAW